MTTKYNALRASAIVAQALDNRPRFTMALEAIDPRRDYDMEDPCGCVLHDYLQSALTLNGIEVDEDDLKVRIESVEIFHEEGGQVEIQVPYWAQQLQTLAEPVESVDHLLDINHAIADEPEESTR